MTADVTTVLGVLGEELPVVLGFKEAAQRGLFSRSERSPAARDAEFLHPIVRATIQP